MFLGAEKRVKQFFLHVRGNAWSGVFYFNHDGVGAMILQTNLAAARAQRDRAIMTDRFGGILHQIDEHLLELLRIASERSVRGRINLERNIFALKVRAEQI